MKYFMERKNPALLFAMLLFAPCFAAAFPSVGFQIIQHDPSGDEIRNCVYIIEDALFDTFFSNGIIISNSPPVSSDPKEFDSVFRKSLDEARESGTAETDLRRTNDGICHGDNGCTGYKDFFLYSAF